jgi:hypothetical protein
MAKKIPPDAFDFYFALGPSRSYKAVAEKYGASKRAVVGVAKRENWQKRLLEVETKAREAGDKKKVESLHAAKEYHLQALRLVLGKGIEGLHQMAIRTPRDAIAAIGLAVREIRVELGEPSDRTAVSIEDTIRREYDRWLVHDEAASDLDTKEEVDDDETLPTTETPE